MTEKKAVGSSYIINFIYFQVRYGMSHWSKIVRQDMPTPNRESILYIISFLITAAPAPTGKLELLEQLHVFRSASTGTLRFENFKPLN